MKFLSLAFATANIVRCTFATMAIHNETRFGLTFSSTTITASRFVSADAVNLTRFPITNEYQDFYRYETMRPMVNNLTEQLSYAPEFSAISLPSVLRRDSWYGATGAVFGESEYVTKLSTTHQAACWAYGFLEGRNLGRALDDCKEDGPENYILVLEFEAEYLYAWLVNVAFELGAYWDDEKKFCERCGEKFRKVRASPEQTTLHAWMNITAWLILLRRKSATRFTMTN
jgi:hypothetical protein